MEAGASVGATRASTWKSASTVVVEYTPPSGAARNAGAASGDAGWQRQDGP